jgi:hypothetical protein
MELSLPHGAERGRETGKRKPVKVSHSKKKISLDWEIPTLNQDWKHALQKNIHEKAPRPKAI